jgi:hypothetical protein
MKEATLTAYPSMQEWVLNTLQEYGVRTVDDLGALLRMRIGPNYSWPLTDWAETGAIGLRLLGNGEYLLNLNNKENLFRFPGGLKA